MELNQYFFGLIVSIGLIHLASVAVQYIGAFRSKRSLVDKNSLAKPGERGDWYVFFHCADLLGKEPTSTSLDRSKHEQPAAALPCTQANKQSARLRARL